MIFGSRKLGLRYSENSKAGCSSIKRALLQADGIQVHADGAEHEHDHWRTFDETWRPGFVFTFVRHPLARLQSVYREKSKNGLMNRLDSRCPLTAESTFAEFVAFVVNENPLTCNRHWAPQTVALDRGPALDFIGKLERAAVDWRRLQERFAGLPDLPHVNTTKSDGSDAFDSRLLRWAESFYREDLVRFGYGVELFRPRPTVDAWKHLQGYLSEEEAAELQRIARHGNVLEVGTWKGKSAVAMAATARRVTSVDYFYGDSYAGRGNTCCDAWKNLCVTAARERVTLMTGAFTDVLPTLDMSAYDVIHYDADHTYTATKLALELICEPANGKGIRDGAALAVHDYDNRPAHAGVCKAVQEVSAKHGRTIHTAGRLAVLTKPAFKPPPCCGGR